MPYKNPEDQRQATRKHYRENKAYYIDKSKRHGRVMVAYAVDYLTTHGCVDCGEDDPVVLDFDHVRGVKRKDVKRLARNNCSLESLIAEIAKCEIRCANCHRRRTYSLRTRD